MNREEALERAIELKEHSAKFESVSYLESDTEFFDYVIKELDGINELDNDRKIFRSLTEKKIELIKRELEGLDRSEWGYIKGGIDMYFSSKAANLKIDDSTYLDNYLKRKY